MKIDVSKELSFQTARSGGKGGQNVNKVETMVEGYFNIAASSLISEEQKKQLFHKLESRINAEGLLQVRSRIHRTQLANKDEVVEKMNEMIGHALKKEKQRVATKPSRKAKEKRMEAKKKKAEIKEGRKRPRFID